MALLAVSDVEQWGREMGVGSLSDADLVGTGSPGSGHQCFCVVLIKIEIYSLPAFMGLGHCGDAYLNLPPPLSRQAGREADIINPSLLPHLFHFITPSSSQLGNKP